MLTEKQIKQVQDSYRNGDDFVFVVGNKVFVSSRVLKHRKEATIEFVDCQEVDESCFENNGDYYGDVLPNVYNYIIADCYADNENIVSTYYYDDEVREITKIGRNS